MSINKFIKTIIYSYKLKDLGAMKKFQVEENFYSTNETPVDQERLNCKKPQKDDNKKIIAFMILLFAAVFALLLGIAGTCIGFGLELSKLQNDQTSNQQDGILHQQLSQQNESINTLQQQLIDTLYQQLSQQNDTLYQQLSQQNQQLNSSTQLLLSVLEGLVGNFPFHPAVSCAALPPSSPSGYYWVRASNSSAVRVYCDMTTSCGDGGWMRVASLDFSNASTTCPSGLRERVDSGIRTCGIESSEAACPSVMLSTSGVEYTKVCGKILAYQFSSPDAFRTGSDIDGNYVDGVSLTYGDTPRNHIWTFVAALDEFGSGDSGAVCPCSSSVSSVGTSPPSFVGDDYFCDAGAVTFAFHTFYGDNPLWDGSGCGSTSTCCSFNTPPWFLKELSSPISDDIEMRVCSEELRVNEDIAMSSVEIYVQ